MTDGDSQESGAPTGLWQQGTSAVCLDADGTLWHARVTAAAEASRFCSAQGRDVTEAEAAAAMVEVSAALQSRWQEVVRRVAAGEEPDAAEEIFWSEYNARLLARWGLAAFGG